MVLRRWGSQHRGDVALTVQRPSPGFTTRTLLATSLLVIGAFVLPTPAVAQGPRAGVVFNDAQLLEDARERLTAEGRLAAKRSGGKRGLLIGMAVGTVVGAGLGYLACRDAQAAVPCSSSVPVFAAGGLGFGGLLGYSIGRESP